MTWQDAIRVKLLTRPRGYTRISKVASAVKREENSLFVYLFIYFFSSAGLFYERMVSNFAELFRRVGCHEKEGQDQRKAR